MAFPERFHNGHAWARKIGNPAHGAAFASGLSQYSNVDAGQRREKSGTAYIMTEPSDSAKTPRASAADLEEARLRQQAIGVKLRHMFDQVINEPVPDEFLDILRKAGTTKPVNGAGEA